MEELLQRFQTLRGTLLPATGKRPNRYPHELREIAVAYSQAVQEQGVRRAVAAKHLGVDIATLAAWERQQGGDAAVAVVPVPTRPQLRRIEVVDPAPGMRPLCLVGPRGLRVEGVSIEQIAALFERLAC